MGFFDTIKKYDDWVMMPGAGEVLEEVSGAAASERNLQAAKEARDANNANVERNIALQKEFAQHGIRWRVADAVAAGIHPLAALGASGASFSPVSLGVDPLPSGKEWRDNLGQNVRSAVMGRLDPVTRISSGLAIERQGLENDLLRLQIANYAKGQSGSSDVYLTGQADSHSGDPHVIDVPLKRVVADPLDPSKEAGAIQDWQIVRTENGYAVVPAQGVKQAIEDSPMEYQWLVRASRRTYTLPDGQKAKMNPLTGELKPIARTGFWRGVWDKFQRGPFGLLE